MQQLVNAPNRPIFQSLYTLGMCFNYAISPSIKLNTCLQSPWTSGDYLITADWGSLRTIIISVNGIWVSSLSCWTSGHILDLVGCSSARKQPIFNVRCLRYGLSAISSITWSWRAKCVCQYASRRFQSFWRQVKLKEYLGRWNSRITRLNILDSVVNVSI